MLNELHIQQFAIVDQISIFFNKGLTCITGETGAGKSIMFDALGLIFGDKAEASQVRQNCTQASITAIFNIAQIPKAKDWLNEMSIDYDDDEIILRRVIQSKGKSRAFINDKPCTLSNLKSLGNEMIVMHGQHEHQNLTKVQYHIKSLDYFGAYHEHLSQIKQHYQSYQKCNQALQEATLQQATWLDRAKLIRFQLDELEALAPEADEFEKLTLEHKKLSNQESIIQQTANCLSLFDSNNPNNLDNNLLHLSQTLGQILQQDDQVKDIYQMCQDAKIQLDEVKDSLTDYQYAFNTDPERIEQVNERMSSFWQLARKHQVKPEQLNQLQNKLTEELEILESNQSNIESLKSELANTHQAYQEVASKLSKARQKAGKQLSQVITDQIQALGMPKAEFEVKITTDTELINIKGQDHCEFYIKTNPGMPSQPIQKIASGGELARISLAIQVACQQETQKTTLIFDEVDSGIGGPTAEVVGKLLRSLSCKQQTLCVTHLPQVASLGHQQIQVSKIVNNHETHTEVTTLTEATRVEELARMIGGIELTKQTLAAAKQMLKSASKQPAPTY